TRKANSSISLQQCPFLHNKALCRLASAGFQLFELGGAFFRKTLMKCAGHQKSATPFTVKFATNPRTGPNSLKRFSVFALGCYPGDGAFLSN
ncbi:hypothetical protein, partial [Candidatus Erwinia dacicola]|uniref:hypothetical protein n=1 Tax=Candidatus Erwinia dacicola TaxID=252393 RepID=UPI001C9CCA38